MGTFSIPSVQSHIWQLDLDNATDPTPLRRTPILKGSGFDFASSSGGPTLWRDCRNRREG